MAERFGGRLTGKEHRYGLPLLNHLLTDGLPYAKRDESLFNRTLLDIFHCDNFLELAKRIEPHTVTITIAAGNATRMIEALSAGGGAAFADQYNIDPHKPRACVHVDNVTDAYLPVLTNQSTTSNGVYSLMAMRTPYNKPIGKHIVVVAPEKQEVFRKEIIEPLGIPPHQIYTVEQRRYLDRDGITKPLGHGDALLQLLDNPEVSRILQANPLWIINFVGDVPSPIRTIQAAAALFALRGLPESKDDVSEIIPVVERKNPPYSIYVSRHNIPAGTVQTRNGVLPPDHGRKTNWMNCGVRALWGPDISRIVKPFRGSYLLHDYSQINASGKNELSIDQLIDAWLMTKGKVRLMGLSHPEETHAVKKVDDIPGFGAKARIVLEESRQMYEPSPNSKPINEPLGRLTRHVYREGERFLFQREGVLRHLPHLQKVEGLPLKEARYSLEWRYLSELFGEALMEELAQKISGRSAMVASERYGYGHIFQGRAMLTALSHIGVTGYGVLASDLSNSRERMATRMKQKTLELIHHKKGMADLAKLIEGKSPVEFMEELRTVLMLLTSESYMRSAGIDFLDHRNYLLDPFTRLFVKAIQQSDDFGLHDLVSHLFQQFVLTDTKFIDAPLQNGLVSFANTIDALWMIHTHSASARAVTGTPWEKNGIYLYPDPGFSDLSLALPLVVSSTVMPYVVPKYRPVIDTLKRYGIPEKNIFAAGTLTEPISITKAEHKWDTRINKKRRILIPLSGSGNGVPYMKQALVDYSYYKARHSESLYELVLYMGHHNNGETREVRQLIQELGLADDPNIQIKQANNIAEAAEMKWEEKKQAHVEIGKGGESALDTQATATIHLALAGAGPNEDQNVAYAYKRYGSSLPSPWPYTTRDYWRNNPLFLDEINRFPHKKLFQENTLSNLFEQLDDQWDNLHRIALNAFIEADTMAGVTALALALAPLTGDVRFDYRGPLGTRATQRINEWTRNILDEEKQRKRAIMEAP